MPDAETTDLEWAARELLLAAERWLIETNPSMHVNTRRASERLRAVLSERGDA